MATVIIKSSNWSGGQIRVTYTASNGTIKITEIEGSKTDSARSWDETITSINVKVGNSTKSVSLGHYVDFGKNESWVAWGAVDTSWTGLSNYDLSITLPASSSSLSGATFSQTLAYAVTYNANGGSLGSIPSIQIKLYGVDTAVPSDKPTKAGYTFLGWSVPDRGYTDVYYDPEEAIQYNGNQTLKAVWKENVLYIQYHSNYATSAFDGAYNSVSAIKNTHVWTGDFYYDNDYSQYGIADYSTSDGTVYMTRDGYTATGFWGTTVSGGKLVDEKQGFASGQEIAQAFGKDLTNGDVTINVYAQWEENYLEINYWSNYATKFNGTYTPLNTVGGKNVLVYSKKYYYDNKYLSGLLDYDKGSELGMSRVGYEGTGYWGTTIVGGKTLHYDDTTYQTGQAIAQYFNKSITKGNKSINLYAQWKLQGLVHIDNGSKFDKYLVYIDNGVEWELYVPYIDNGTEWNFIS